jgi:hypothetical protein
LTEYGPYPCGREAAPFTVVAANVTLQSQVGRRS